MASLRPVRVFLLLVLCSTVSTQTNNSNTNDVSSLARAPDATSNITLPGGEVVPGGIFYIPENVTDSGDCRCVPSNQCDRNNRIITTGEGIFDTRINDNDDAWNVRQCPDATMQCCKLPPGVTAPPRPQPNPEKAPKCGVRQASALDSLLRIKSGEETDFGEFPWMLALISMPVMPSGEVANVFACGASLIHPRVALTAAHCITKTRKSFPNVQFKIRAGEWDTNSTDELFSHQDRDVAKVIIHEGFNKGSLVNDIALLVLAQPVDLADNVGTICLPEPGDQFVGAGCVATGWGKEAFDSVNPYQTVLRKVDLQVTPSPRCQEELRRTKLGAHFKLNPSFVCASGRSGEDTCKGDGGGPLVCPSPLNRDHYVQVGVVSWGIGCGNGTPAVYTCVSYERAWINGKMQQEGIQAYSAPPISRPN